MHVNNPTLPHKLSGFVVKPRRSVHAPQMPRGTSALTPGHTRLGRFLFLLCAHTHTRTPKFAAALFFTFKNGEGIFFHNCHLPERSLLCIPCACRWRRGLPRPPPLHSPQCWAPVDSDFSGHVEGRLIKGEEETLLCSFSNVTKKWRLSPF